MKYLFIFGVLAAIAAGRYVGPVAVNENQPFKCSTAGAFPHPTDNAKFYYCVPIGSEYLSTLVACSPGYTFDASSQQCVTKSAVESRDGNAESTAELATTATGDSTTDATELPSTAVPSTTGAPVITTTIQVSSTREPVSTTSEPSSTAATQPETTTVPTSTVEPIVTTTVEASSTAESASTTGAASSTGLPEETTTSKTTSVTELETTTVPTTTAEPIVTTTVEASSTAEPTTTSEPSSSESPEVTSTVETTAATEPETTTTQPTTVEPTTEPVSTTNEPSSTESPEETTTSETTTTTEPETTTTQPTTEPVSTTNEPSSTENPEETTIEETATEPETTTAQPTTVESTTEPVSTTGEPSSTESPEETTASETTTTTEPETTTAQPTTEEPIITTTEEPSSAPEETTTEEVVTTETTTEVETTETTEETTTPAPFECTRTGMFPDPTNEKYFYVCIFDGFGYIAISMQCSKGLVFIPDLYRCAAPDTPIPPPAPIECKSVGYYPDPHDCRTYYYCYSNFNGGYLTIKMTCPPKTNFFPKLEICVSNKVYKCKHKKGESTTVGVDVPSQAPEEKPSCNQEHPVFDCPSAGLHPDPHNDRKYYQCQIKNGKIEVTENWCPWGSKFTPFWDKCIDSQCNSYWYWWC